MARDTRTTPAVTYKTPSHNRPALRVTRLVLTRPYPLEAHPWRAVGQQGAEAQHPRVCILEPIRQGCAITYTNASFTLESPSLSRAWKRSSGVLVF